MNINVSQSGKHGGDGGNAGSGGAQQGQKGAGGSASNVSVIGRPGEDISVTQSGPTPGKPGTTSDNSYVNVDQPAV